MSAGYRIAGRTACLLASLLIVPVVGAVAVGLGADRLGVGVGEGWIECILLYTFFPSVRPWQ